MYACTSSETLAIESRFIASGTVEGIGAALGVCMGLMWGVGMGREGNVAEVEVGGTIMDRGLKTAAQVASPVCLEAF